MMHLQCHFKIHCSKPGVSKLRLAGRMRPAETFLYIEEIRENYSYPANPAKSCVTESYYYPSDYYQPRPGHVTNESEK